MWKETSYWETTYYELEKLIKNNINDIPNNFSIAANEELNNDTYWRTSIPVNIDKWDIENIQNKKYMYNTHILIQMLADKGVLPFTEGKILVEVSW